MNNSRKLIIAGVVLAGLGIASKFFLDKFLLNNPALDFDDELELRDVEEGEDD
jgi:hypothetical protein